jgi:hypothetical protein
MEQMHMLTDNAESGLEEFSGTLEGIGVLVFAD